MVLGALQCVPETWHPAYFFDIPEQTSAGGVSAIYHGKL